MRTFAAAVLLALILPACSSQPAADLDRIGGSESAHSAPSPTGQASTSEATPAPDPAPSVSSAAAAPTAEPDVAAERRPAPIQPTPATSGGSGAPPQDVGATEPPNSDSSVASRPAEPGTYTYATDGSMTITGGTPHRLPDTTTLHAGTPSDGRQRTVRDLRDEDGRGQVTETTLLYNDTGVFVSRVKVTSDLGGGLRNVREWRVDPPGLLAPAGAEPGDRSEFTMRSADTTARVSVELLRREPVEIGAVRVDTIVTSIDIVVSGAIEGRQETTAWVRPSDFLTVKEHVESDFSSGALRVQMSYRAELQRLTPS